MIRTCLAAILTLLLTGAAHAETAQLIQTPEIPDATSQRKVCYYNAGGFMYHYVIERGLVATPPCAKSIETPFAPVPPRWAVLLKEEREAHENPMTLCYYGLAYGRLEVERISSQQHCKWTAGLEYDPPNPSAGPAELVHEEDAATATNTIPANAKICFYHLLAATHPARFTHYRVISKYSMCPKTFPAH